MNDVFDNIYETAADMRAGFESLLEAREELKKAEKSYADLIERFAAAAASHGVIVRDQDSLKSLCDVLSAVRSGR